MSVERWGTLPTGEQIQRVTLATEDVRVAFLTWGATVQSLASRDTTGAWRETVLGFDALEPYLGPHPFLGCTVGRFANRIAGARFALDGVSHHLTANDGPHALHGGPRHFGVRPWMLVDHTTTSAVFRLVSPDGDMGFPGRLDVRLQVTVDGPTVQQRLTATTDAPTVVNLANHAYFTLHGDAARTIDDHELTIPADAYIAVDDAGIPLPGPPTPVDGTRFDLRDGGALGSACFDHHFVLDAGARIDLVAAGRRLRITTSEPGVQLYTGQELDGTLVGRDGIALRRRAGLCLETQHVPDSPNRPDHPSVRLDPGTLWSSTTTWDLLTGTPPRH